MSLMIHTLAFAQQPAAREQNQASQPINLYRCNQEVTLYNPNKGIYETFLTFSQDGTIVAAKSETDAKVGFLQGPYMGNILTTMQSKFAKDANGKIILPETDDNKKKMTWGKVHCSLVGELSEKYL